MTDYSQKLKRLAQQPAYKKWIFMSALTVALACKHAADFVNYLNFGFPHRPFVFRKAPRAHYIGAAAEKPHRAAFLLLSLVLLVGAAVYPNPAHWVVGWGSLLSFFVIVHSAALIVQRVRNR